MEVYRVKINSWTSSFRYPNLISGFQPTLDVPPLSTILGIINASAGKYINYNGEKLGYYFEYKMKAVDLETIYQIEIHNTQNYPLSKAKSNVMNREFLYDCKLLLYTTSREIINYFTKPVYQLVLGRSGDLASITEIKENLSLEKKEIAHYIRGQIIPFNGNYLPGEIQALPKYFSNSIPRNNLGTEPYSVISYNSNPLEANIPVLTDYLDNGDPIDIYLHEINYDDK